MRSTPSRLPLLYSFRRCPYAMRARLALAASGIRCELREVDMKAKPAELLAVSPKATVPVLVTAGGEVLHESLEIVVWALRQHDPEGWLLADQAHGQARALALIARNDGPFKQALDRYKYASRYEAADPLAERGRAALFLQELDDLLTPRGCLLGERPGLADLAIAPFVRQFALTDRDWFGAQPWPALSAWLQAFEQGARFQAVMRKYPVWPGGAAPGAAFPPDAASS